MDLQKLKGHIPDNVIEQLPDTIAKFTTKKPNPIVPSETTPEV